MIFLRGGFRQTLFAATFVASIALSAPTAAGTVSVELIEISARLIDRFHIGGDEKRFGPLEFVGGLE
ncbi:MAG: hypothetical protein E5X54_08460, partial [Mesorhizobium sp.]